MTITRVGTNQKYADGWEQAFGGRRAKKVKTKPKATAAAKAKKKAAPKKKKAAKKRS